MENFYNTPAGFELNGYRSIAYALTAYALSLDIKIVREKKIHNAIDNFVFCFERKYMNMYVLIPVLKWPILAF